MGNISRKKFFRTVGTIVAGGAITGVSAVVVSKSLKKEGQASASGDSPESSSFVSPYKPTVVFTAQGGIEAFEQHEGKLYVAGAGLLTVMDDYGKTLSRFNIMGESTRDIAVDAEGIYLLRQTSIAVYSHEGKLLREWEACSQLSDYCSFALAEDFVFVTDRDNNNVCQYTRSGDFVRFIDSPNRFIIPSLTFGITYANGKIYCSNSGRHQVEMYSLKGDYLGKFGSAGGGEGYFCGCCNPVYLTATPTGEIISSEKGYPRISCYSADGSFRSLLLNSDMLGEGGTAACKVKIAGAKLFTAGANQVRVYEYDTKLAASGACSGCGVDCRLRNA